MSAGNDDDRLQLIEDELYGVPPGDFVERRRLAVRDAKEHGERELANAIAALRKPTAAAWAINSFVRADGDGISPVLDVGERLRTAVARADGDAMRELARERSRVVVEVTRAIRRHADERGEPLSDAVLAQVEQTLRASMGADEHADVLRRGALSTVLEEAGFGGVAVARGAGRRSKPDTGASSTEADRLAAAERRAAAARTELERAEAELAAARTERESLEAERDEHRARLAAIEQRLRDGQEAERDAVSQVRRARTELTSAEHAIDRAR